MFKKIIFIALLLLAVVLGCTEHQMIEKTIECVNDSDCKENFYCGGGHCIDSMCGDHECRLKYGHYTYGLVYVYSDEDTRNPNWQEDLEEVIPKVKAGILELSGNRIDIDIKILGEIKTDDFCWNPATVGAKFRDKETGEIIYMRTPGSEFKVSSIDVSGLELIENYCDKCILEGNYYKINCSKPFPSDTNSQINGQASRELNFSYGDYDGVFMIFGRMAHVLPNSDEELNYRCNYMIPSLRGYSDLAMGENSILSGGLINCSKFNKPSYYAGIGWHGMVHELLHRFGTIDVYEYGGNNASRMRALEIDPRADESVMGNDYKSCMEPGHFETDGNICEIGMLEKLYLDKQNKQLIGIG